VFDELQADFPDAVKYRFGPMDQSFARMDFRVQYRETAFNFVSRLMEERGIFYFFEHAADGHTLVLSDSPTAHNTWPGRSRELYDPEGGIGELKGTVASLQISHTMRPGKYILRDHHFERLKDPLEVIEPSVIRIGGNDKFEVYDYPGEYARLFSK